MRGTVLLQQSVFLVDTVLFIDRKLSNDMQNKCPTFSQKHTKENQHYKIFVYFEPFVVNLSSPLFK